MEGLLEMPKIPNFVIAVNPIYASHFEIQADLPVEILENIISYDLDTSSKKLTISCNLNIENLSKFQLLSVERIKILVHDKSGAGVICNEIEHITNPSYLSLSGSYESGDILKARLTFNFGTLYQTFQVP